MKIKVVVKELQRKMQRSLSVIQAKITIPALENVKIDVLSVNKAIISGSDLGMSMIQSVDVVLQSDSLGSMLLPAKRLAAVLAVLPSEAEVILESDGVTPTQVSCGKKFKAVIPAVSTALFPAIEQMPEAQFTINNAALKLIIARTEFAAPSKGGRTAVPSVLIESTATLLRGAATDGFRIAVADVPGAGAGEFTIQLPKTVLGVLKELPGAVVTFSKTENSLFFNGDGEQILVRQPQTQFPPYQRAFAQKYVTELNVPVPTLKSMIEIVSPFMDSDVSAVNVSAADGELYMVAESALTGTGTAQETVAQTGVANKLRMNPKFVLEFLSQVEDTVKLELSTERTLAKFTNAKGDYQYFIMPMQEKQVEAKKEK